MDKIDMIVAVILDRSGSMMGRTDAVIEHFNNYKEEVADLPENVNLSVYQFDTVFETIAENTPANEVPDLTPAVYYPRGGTALLDAIGRTISHLTASPDLPNKVVIVINTDGYENSSHEFTKPEIQALIKDRQSTRDWQFVFIGAGIDAFSVGTNLGVRGQSTYTTTNTARGYDDSYYVLTAATASYAAGAAVMDMASIPIPDEEPEKTDIDSKINKRAKAKSESR